MQTDNASLSANPVEKVPTAEELEQPAASKRPLYSRILLAGAILGLLANGLFYGRLPGISALIFVLAGLTALYMTGRSAGVALTWSGAWPAVPLVFLSTMIALRAAPFLSFLNTAACMVLLVALAYTYPGRNALNLGFLDYLVDGIGGLIEICLLRPLQTIERTWRESQANRRPPHRFGAVIRGILMAIPLLVVFKALFSAADVVFERIVKEAFAWLNLENLPELVTRTFFSIFVGWLVTGGLAYAVRALTDRELRQPSERTGHLGITEAAVVLGSVNMLFALFVGVQVRYFFGGQANIHGEGFTYSEYARRGFAELVVVAILTLGLIFIAQSLIIRRGQRQILFFEGLAGLLVLLTGVILVSAYQRMQLYEEAYGFTQLRFLVYVFIAWLALLLIISLVTLHFDRPRWFATAVFVAGLGYIASLNLINMDAFIARQNLERFMAGESFSSELNGRYVQPVDAGYLTTLSDDAIPTLLGAYAHLPLNEMEILGGALHLRLNELNALADTDGWPQPGGTGWNVARWRAWILLRAAEPGLQNFEPKRDQWEFPID